METIDHLHKLYSPKQPSVRNYKLQIDYSEAKPTTNLKKFIHCFWQLKTKAPLDEKYLYKVVSDGCIDIFLNVDRPKESYVMGFYSKFHTFPIGKEFNYIGIRFYPSVFPQLFCISAKKLTNTVTSLDVINNSLAIKIKESNFKKFCLDEIAGDLNSILGQFFSDRNLDSDLRFNEALEKILRTNGVLATENELNTGLSPRQLRRLFNHYIGTSPKSFCKVVRFQFILNAKHAQQSLKKNKLYYDAGFFDQAHFIKDFKNFYGVTPSEAFAS